MATGYDEQGMKDSLICVEPPDGDGANNEVEEEAVGGGGVGGVGEVTANSLFDWNPNVLALSNAGFPYDLTNTLINYGAIGLNDYSVECWLLHCSIIQDWRPAGGGGNDNIILGWSGCGIALQGTGMGIVFDSAATGVVDANSGFFPMEWTHVVGNFDRSGSAALYMNGRGVGSVAINLGAAENFVDTRRRYNSLAIDSTLLLRDSIWMGPFAYHNRPLSNDEIRSAYLNKSVNNLGPVDTAGCYTFQDHIRQKAAPTANYGWILNVGYTHGGTLPDDDWPFYAPWPAYANLAYGGDYNYGVVDSSGNDRHITLCRTLYNQAWSWTPFFK